MCSVLQGYATGGVSCRAEEEQDSGRWAEMRFHQD